MTSHKNGLALSMLVVNESPPTLKVYRWGLKSRRLLAEWTCKAGEVNGPNITPKELVAMLLRDGHSPSEPVLLSIPPFFFRTSTQKGNMK